MIENDQSKNKKNYINKSQPDLLKAQSIKKIKLNDENKIDGNITIVNDENKYNENISNIENQLKNIIKENHLNKEQLMKIVENCFILNEPTDLKKAIEEKNTVESKDYDINEANNEQNILSYDDEDDDDDYNYYNVYGEILHNPRLKKCFKFIRDPGDFAIDPTKPETWVDQSKLKDAKETDPKITDEIKSILSKYKSYSDFYEFYYRNKKKKTLVCKNVDDIDYDEYSDYEMECHTNFEDLKKRERIPLDLSENGDILNPDEWKPVKFLKNKIRKNSVAIKLIRIRDEYYEAKNNDYSCLIKNVVDGFDFLCYFFDMEELKQLRRARILKNILYDDYKNSDFGSIKEFEKLFEK